MPKDKAGNKLTWREYGARWRRGIEAVTPLQQVNIQLKGTIIIILGLLCGIVISIIGLSRLWWLMIILIGGLFNTVIQWVGQWQKKQILKRLFDTPKPDAFESGRKIIKMQMEEDKKAFDKGIDLACSNKRTPFEKSAVAKFNDKQKHNFVEDDVLIDLKGVDIK